MLTTLAIANYRSIRRMVLPLGPLYVVTGANGSGKSNLYVLARPDFRADADAFPGARVRVSCSWIKSWENP